MYSKNCNAANSGVLLPNWSFFDSTTSFLASEQACKQSKHKTRNSLNDDFSIITLKDTKDICKRYDFFSCGTDIDSFSDVVVNELLNCDILVTVYSGKNIPIKEAQNLWAKKVTSVFVDDPTDYLDYF